MRLVMKATEGIGVNKSQDDDLLECWLLSADGLACSGVWRLGCLALRCVVVWPGWVLTHTRHS